MWRIRTEIRLETSHDNESWQTTEWLCPNFKRWKTYGQTEWRRRNCTGTQVPLDMFDRTVQQSEGSQFQEGLQQDDYPLAFSELITYIVETKSSKEGPCILRLADMVQLFKQRLEQLGIGKPDVNSTSLMEKLLAEISELEAHKQERDVILTFDEDIGLALSQASDYSDAIILVKWPRSCADICLITRPSLTEPSTMGVLKRQFHPVWFSLWAWLNIVRTSNLNWDLMFQRQT